MSDLHLGETMTEAFKFVSHGTAHTFTFDFPADKVVFNNITQWAATGGNIPRSVWFRNTTPAGYAQQEVVLADSGVTGNYNFKTVTTNGFTDVSTAQGPIAYRALISGVTKANPCVVTTSAPNNFQTNQIVRITDLGDIMPTPRGMSQLDGNRYLITVLSTTTFSLSDPITGDPIDSSNYETYVSGGRVDVESRVISLNNPQQYPYNVTPYLPNPFTYEAPVFMLLAGTAVMGNSADVFIIECYKWGQFTNLGTFTS